MKTVNFLYGRTTFDLEVPDDTPVLTSNVDALKSDKDGYEIVKEAMDHPIEARLYHHYQRPHTSGSEPGYPASYDQRTEMRQP